MNNITTPIEALEDNVVEVSACVVGAGAAPPTIPASHQHVVQGVTRSGAGTYIITLTPKARAPVLLAPYEPVVVCADSKRAYYTAIDPVAGTIAVVVKNNADAAATDLALTTDRLYITLKLRNSKVKYGAAAAG